jgi:transcriptional regulator GlxA family with amidase domain
MNIGIYLYEQAEVLDFSGPFEVFTTASRISGGENPFNVFLIGESGEPVLARANYKITPHYNIHNHPKIDVLLISGGVYSEEIKKQPVIEWVHTQATRASIVASVCTGTFLLAAANLLRSRRVTTHWEDILDLRNQFPELTVIENMRWVEDENIISQP